VTTPPFDPPTDEDLAIVSAQLGRPARGVLGVSARCVCGAPTVVATAPRLAHGEPFPTLYYLTHPAATAAISHLEAEHVMAELQQDLADDEELAERYAAAHRAYLADRESIDVVPTRVKCLHALAAHSLSAGPGVNPIGDIALERADWSPLVCECRDYSAAG
jgi:hypothetical protein